MPIVRSYMCPECAHQLTVTLTMEQVDEPAPACPRCSASEAGEPMRQEFKAPGIVGHSARSKAEAITDDILRNDYKVSDMNRSPSRPNLSYQSPSSDRHTWGVAREALESAIASGRRIRQQYGTGLDILQANLKSGKEPDLIAESKKRAIKIY